MCVIVNKNNACMCDMFTRAPNAKSVTGICNLLALEKHFATSTVVSSVLKWITSAYLMMFICSIDIQ